MTDTRYKLCSGDREGMSGDTGEADSLAPSGLRAEVAAFAGAMEAKLRENDHKGGWKECNLTYLETRLREEMRELTSLFQAWHLAGSGFMGYRRDEVNAKIIREAADVANFAMMIADVCGALSTQSRAERDVKESPESPPGERP